MTEENTTQEEWKISGDGLIKKVKELIQEGNVRRIILKNESGHVLMEIPLTVVVVGTVLAPILAAVGAVAALVAECSITVIKKTEKKKSP